MVRRVPLNQRGQHAVAGALHSTLETAEIQRVAARPSAAPGAYELYLQALPLYRAWDSPSVERALELSEAAIEQDPRFAPALMLAGFVRSQLLYSGWADDPAKCQRLGLAPDSTLRGHQLVMLVFDGFLVLLLAVGIAAAWGVDIDAIVEAFTASVSGTRLVKSSCAAGPSKHSFARS